MGGIFPRLSGTVVASEARLTIKHMVLFRFRPDLDPDLRRTVLDRLADLPNHYPAMRRFGLGENASERDHSFTHAMTMEFASFDELRTYLNSERHQALVRDWFTPSIAARAIASFEAS